MNPASHSAWLMHGNVQRARGDMRQSVVSVNRAIALNPNDVDSYIFLADIKTNQGEIAESIELIERARELSTRTNNWHKTVYGKALYADKRYEEARDVLVSVDDLTFAQRLLAMTYAQMGDQQKAESTAKLYLERYPEFSVAQHMDDNAMQREEDRAHYVEGLEKAGFPA